MNCIFSPLFFDLGMGNSEGSLFDRPIAATQASKLSNPYSTNMSRGYDPVIDKHSIYDINNHALDDHVLR